MQLNLTIFKKGLILVSVPLLFQLTFIGLFGEAQRRNADAQSWSLHTKEVLVQIQVVMAGLVDAEAGSLSYVITRDPVTLAPYESAAREVPKALETLKTLVSDHHEQQMQLEKLAQKATHFLDWHGENIRLGRDGAWKQVGAHLKSLKDKALVDDIRKEIAVFTNTVEKLDDERQTALADSQRLLNWLLILGTAVSLVVTGSVALVFSRRISGRLATLTDNVRRLAHGEELSSPMTGGDEINAADRALRDLKQQLATSQEALHKQTRLLQSILESMGDGVVVADEHGKFVVFNPAAEQIIGVGATTASPDEWSEIYGSYLPDGITPFPVEENPLVRAIRGEQSNEVEMFLRNSKVPEGVWINITGRPIRDEKGALQGGVVVFHNFTERKKAEAEIRTLNNELEARVQERTSELADANRDLAQKNQENEMFVYSVSHDLRSPLVNLEGFSKELSLVCKDIRAIIDDHHLPEAQQKRGLAMIDGDMAEAIRFIQNGVMRLSSIIDALLRLSRAGRVEFQFQRVDVAGVVRRIVDSMSATINERNATVTIDSLSPVWGDPTAVEQVFANLIGNALNYLDANRPGSIAIGSVPRERSNGHRDQSDLQTFYVKDNGLGIPELYKQKIFKAFQRVHPDVAKGEGIGLTIVERVLHRHGGKIWFESNEGEGTTFFVTLQVPQKTSGSVRSSAKLQPMLAKKEICV